MCRENRFRSVFSCLLLLALSLTSLTLGQSERSKHENLPSGVPVLWRRPVDIASRDLYWGPGGKAMQPNLAKVTFIEEQKGGYSKKYRVRDASGREWVAKIGKEAQSETAAVRLLWAAGYETEINYLVPRVDIAGKGSFSNVRFEARPENVKRLGEWRWSKNPFVGTREFQALKVMMILMNNWDIKDSNNRILADRGRSNNERRYIISDLGATFGHASGTPIFWRFTRSRNNPAKYAKSEFVKDIRGDRVKFHYGGKRANVFKNIRIEEARWLGNWLSRLSNRQLSDVFRAANYSPSEVEVMTRTVKARINELVRLPQNEKIGKTR